MDATTLPTLLAGYIYWSVSPELLKLGPLTIRWYGLLFALGFYIGFFIMRWIFRVEGKKEAHLNNLLLTIAGGALIGARLGHCLFYEPWYYLHHPWQILAIWQGGLASHGGAAGILIAIYFYTRRHPEESYLWLFDRIVVPAALAGALIRIGNLFNSEILGNPTHVPWAFVFTRVSPEPRHPAQLYEAACYLIIFVVLLLIYNRLRTHTPRGLIFGIFLITVFTARFFLEFIKERQADYEKNFPLSVGQWLSIPFVVLGVFLLWRALRRRWRSSITACRPG